MATTAIATIGSLWDDERDNAFFRITASVFSCEFTYGAGVLLASYDDESTADISTPATSAGTAMPSASSVATSSATPHVTSR